LAPGPRSSERGRTPFLSGDRTNGAIRGGASLDDADAEAEADADAEAEAEADADADAEADADADAEAEADV